nr:gap junction beta-5 protein-like [Pelodiscus sinensis]|eukprot:XP_006125041.1 gap junction beta-5 protein-like [Pelodiscus sinensis]
MPVEAVTSLLSGTSPLAPRLCRTSLAAVFMLRLGALVVGARTLWRGEVGDLACNPSVESCRHACFDAAFPVSPFSLFALQLAAISSHALASFWHAGLGKGSWRPPMRRGRQPLLWLPVGSLLCKAVLEGVFLVTFHALYGHFPALVRCPPSPCPPAVTCAIRKAWEKDAFNHFMASSSWACLVLSLLGAQHAAARILREAPARTWPKGAGRRPCV